MYGYCRQRKLLFLNFVSKPGMTKILASPYIICTMQLIYLTFLYAQLLIIFQESCGANIIKESSSDEDEVIIKHDAFPKNNDDYPHIDIDWDNENICSRGGDSSKIPIVIYHLKIHESWRHSARREPAYDIERFCDSVWGFCIQKSKT